MELNKSYPLIEITNNNQKIILSYDTLALLRQSSQLIQNFTSVGIVGNLLTGKSSLFNQLSYSKNNKNHNNNNIFKISNNIISGTKGIFISILNIDSQIKNQKFLFLDCQGFGRTDSNHYIQLKLLSIMAILSRHLIFNTFGALDKSIFSKLAMLEKLMPCNQLPKSHLIFVQRDFALQLIGKNNKYQEKQINPNQYLKAFLNQLQSSQKRNIFSVFNENSLNCFLMSNPSEKGSYKRTLDQIRQHLLQSAVIKSTKIDKNTFVLRLQALGRVIQDLQSNSITKTTNQMSLKDLLRIQSQIVKQQYSLQLTNFKQHIQGSLNDINKELPLPVQFIQFKLQTLITNYFKSLQSQSQQKKSLHLQKILSNSIKQFTQKIKNKLLLENSQQAKKFISSKVQKIMKIDICDFFLLEKQINQVLKQLENNYSFIPNDVLNQTEKQIWHQQCKNIYKKYVQNYNRIRQKELKQIQDLMRKNQIHIEQISKFENQNKQLNSKINTLSYKAQKMKEKQEQLKKRMSQYEKESKQQFKFAKQKQEEIQSILRQNLSYENKFGSGLNNNSSSNKKNQILQHQKAAEKIIQSINKLSGSLTSKETIQEISVYKDKIKNLTQMNRFLRQKVQQLQNSNNVKIIQQQYKNLQQRYKNLQEQMFFKINEKITQIKTLSIKLQSYQIQKNRLTDQISIIKSSFKQKHKGLQILQKIISQKDLIIQNQRKDMLQRIQKFKQEINKLNKHIILSDQNSAQIIQKYRNQVNSFKLKNQHLIKENQSLLKSLQQNKQSSKQVLKNQKIVSLQSQICQLKYDIQKTHQMAKQTALQYDKIILSRQQTIQQYKQKLIQYRKKLDMKQQVQLTYFQKIKILQRKIVSLQIQNQRNQGVLQRNRMLSNNKQRHYQDSIKKLKTQQKQQKSTFNTMLNQLRFSPYQKHNNGYFNNNSQKKKALKLIQNVQKVIQNQFNNYIGDNNTKNQITNENVIVNNSQKKSRRDKCQSLSHQNKTKKGVLNISNNNIEKNNCNQNNKQRCVSTSLNTSQTHMKTYKKAGSHQYFKKQNAKPCFYLNEENYTPIIARNLKNEF